MGPAGPFMIWNSPQRAFPESSIQPLIEPWEKLRPRAVARQSSHLQSQVLRSHTGDSEEDRGTGRGGVKGLCP